MDLFCLYLMSNEIKYLLYVYLLSATLFSEAFVDCFTHLKKISLIFFLLLIFENSLYVLDTNPVANICFSDFFVPLYSFFLVVLKKLQLIYSVVPISAVQQSDPVIHIYMYIYVCVCIYILVYTYMYTHTHFFPYIIFHHGLAQEIGYSSLCYTAGTHWLSILNVIVCIY